MILKRELGIISPREKSGLLRQTAGSRVGYYIFELDLALKCNINHKPKGYISFIKNIYTVRDLS